MPFVGFGRLRQRPNVSDAASRRVWPGGVMVTSVLAVRTLWHGDPRDTLQASFRPAADPLAGTGEAVVAPS